MEHESNGNMMLTGFAKVSLGSLLLYFFTLSCLLAVMFIGKDVVACHGFFPEMGMGVMGFMQYRLQHPMIDNTAKRDRKLQPPFTHTALMITITLNYR